MKFGLKAVRRDYEAIKLEIEQRRIKRLNAMCNSEAVKRANQQRIRELRSIRLLKSKPI